jgi:hypothetical protein
MWLSLSQEQLCCKLEIRSFVSGLHPRTALRECSHGLCPYWFWLTMRIRTWSHRKHLSKYLMGTLHCASDSRQWKMMMFLLARRLRVGLSPLLRGSELHDQVCMHDMPLTTRMCVHLSKYLLGTLHCAYDSRQWKMRMYYSAGCWCCTSHATFSGH